MTSQQAHLLGCAWTVYVHAVVIDGVFEENGEARCALIRGAASLVTKKTKIEIPTTLYQVDQVRIG
jgi:hypothetical protein